jgi:uncharacterized protein
MLAEATYLIQARLGPQVLDGFLASLESGDLTLDCGEHDWERIRELVRRYVDLPLGAADASVVACAERSSSPILTLDFRDFRVVAGEGRVRLSLES